MRSTPILLLAVGLLTTSVAAQSDEHISHTPPVGPPWVMDFGEARTQALRSGKPIFLYSTKTY